ncbi:tRNA pseudouridine(38/39) synthase [Zerene cesonia]|uniref:tRNA pseudouridine(38/39) synthase n=1 Tax=Zerene cesonia TaxID=33412 RepID=UPI0018E5768C|nr:tRNA pseudouridine(38/39) synthase [Zerene cesonia]
MEKLPPKSKKNKVVTREELLNLNKEDLVDRIIQLEAHNTQLRNVISRNKAENSENVDGSKRKFDFTKCHYRKVFLRILYFGWDYQGLAVQEDSAQTIEHHLFHALIKSCLIEKRETSQYHRCGRTDKGVSAFGQVISISLRSRFPPSEQTNCNTEMPYCKILNRLLPKDIRAIAWMPVPNDRLDYSARFDCKKRQYKYYFPKSSLNLLAMREACSHLIGSHDFRHLCKMDVGNGVTEFRREILTADIVAIDKNDMDKPTSMYTLLIEGNAFLWHQIRCIMAVLLLVGEGKEAPSVVTELLDVETHSRKPQYHMALDLPLNLFKCTYDVKSDWIYDMSELKTIICDLQSMWTLHSIKTTMIRDCIEELQNVRQMIGENTSEKETACNKSDMNKEYNENRDSNSGMNVCVTETQDVANNKLVNDTTNDVCEKGTADTKYSEIERDSVVSYTECLIQGVKARVYTPLLKREKCSSLEERIEYYKKKRKIMDN